MAGEPVSLDEDSLASLEWQCRVYSEAWYTLTSEEARDAYGPHAPLEGTKKDLELSGNCVFDVRFEAVEDSNKLVRGRWRHTCVGTGRQFAAQQRVGQYPTTEISRTHPDLDFRALATVHCATTQGGEGQMCLELSEKDRQAVLEAGGAYRVDMQLGWVSLLRQAQELDRFVKIRGQPTRLQALVCGRDFDTDERLKLNRPTTHDAQPEPPASASGHRVVSASGISFVEATLEASGVTERLNESQLEAVQASLAHVLTLVQGPPGSGKTSVVDALAVVHACRPGFAARPRVLCAAPSNAGADNALLRHARHVPMSTAVLGRFGRVATTQAAARPYSLAAAAGETEEWTRSQKARRRIRAAAHKDLLGKTAVFGTLEMCADLRHAEQPPPCVAVVIVDEAAQATEPMSVIPLTFLAKDGRVALVGDHMQLTPTVLCQSAKEKGLGRSMFERLFYDKGCAVAVLSEQYRMRKRLWRWPNTCFYEGRVGTADSAEQQQPVQGLKWDSPLAFVDVKAWERKDGNSFCNDAEARCAVGLVWDAINSGSVGADEVAIITPYAAQTRRISEIMRAYPDLSAVAVRDIDGFQGQERDFVVVSFVRSNGTGSVGFVDDSNRVNVILTRARRGLAVLGNRATLRYCTTSGLSRFLAYAHKLGVAYEYERGDFRPAQAKLPPMDEPRNEPHGAHGGATRAANLPRNAIPRLWSMAKRRQSAPDEAVIASGLIKHAEELRRSVPFVLALARMMSLPTHSHGVQDAAAMSPFDWDRKAWSREHFFASVGLELDPGNAVLAAALRALVLLSEAPDVMHRPINGAT